MFIYGDRVKEYQDGSIEVKLTVKKTPTEKAGIDDVIRELQKESPSMQAIQDENNRYSLPNNAIITVEEGEITYNLKDIHNMKKICEEGNNGPIADELRSVYDSVFLSSF